MTNDPAERGRELIEGCLTVNQRTGEKEIRITTSQLRKILSAVNILQNSIAMDPANDSELKADSAAELKYLKARIAYQIGRADKREAALIKVLKSLMTEVDAVGSDRRKFDAFCRYSESIVAYHKFYGGRD